MSPTTKRIILIVLAVVLATAAFVLRVHEDLHDYEVDHRAGQRMLAGEDLYQAADGHYIYKYLPGAAVLEMPLSLLSLEVARVILYALLIVAMFVLLRRSHRLLPETYLKPTWLMPVTFFILAKYFAREIDLGQINMFITVLLLFMLQFLIAADETGEPRKETTAGILWGLAATLKPYGFIFLPYFIVTRRWRALAGGLATFSALAIVPSVFYGVAGNVAQHRAWLQTLTNSDPGQLTNPNNTSLIGFFARSTGDLTLSWWLYGAAVGLLALIVLVVVLKGRELDRPVVLDGALLMMLIPLISPLGWDYVFLMSALAVMLQLQQRHEFGDTARWALIVNLTIIGLFITDVVGHTAHEFYTDWTLTTISFLVVAAFLVALRWKKAC